MEAFKSQPGLQKRPDTGPTYFVEMESDDVTVGGSPPYIYTVTVLIKDDHKLVLEVINLRKDGTIDGSAPFGDFIVLRAGLHLFYAPVKK